MNWQDTKIRLRLQMPAKTLGRIVRADRRDGQVMLERTQRRINNDGGKVNVQPER